MPTVTLDGRRLGDWHAFHAECRTAFGFPGFYGGNMDAWIDCLSGLRDDDGMTRFALGPDEVLRIELAHAGELRRAAPEILEALRACAEEVNERCAENGEKPVLDLVLR
ncbi:MAG TPA: barstar family protein [Noviherbaspirillum sp.]|uniref:barstar family protein n=1 Tax=Noviherbaspirillum sp. TaxID=1926288 RepID=UPI002D4D7BCA|nr:barstar family protein [Noviherbaspirillum sp.]HYD94351.1 barstar family protein [Noviherbaspirillum sp.]